MRNNQIYVNGIITNSFGLGSLYANQPEVWEGYYGKWEGGLFSRTRGTHEGTYGDGFIPVRLVKKAGPPKVVIFILELTTLALMLAVVVALAIVIQPI
jgi:hypothetical protein